VALVFGDSMTEQGTDDPGETMQGWWSMVGYELGWFMVTSAQGGGGVVKRGYGCYGSSIRERDSAVVDRVRPDWIIVAAGYNDRYVCVNGVAKRAAIAWRTGAMVKAFEHLATLADKYGIPRSHVGVTVPWGPAAVQDRHELVVEISTAAAKAGVSWVNVRRLAHDESWDGVHPNRQGSELVASVVLTRIRGLLGD
jgi:lysophospholipase L1-like esterase